MKLKLQFETDEKIIISGRVSRAYNTGKLYGCDVCWTCERFDMKSMACNPHPWAEQVNFGNPSVHIVSPGFYRCSFWTVKNES